MARRTDLGKLVLGASIVGGVLWALSKVWPESDVDRIRRFVVGRVRRAARILGIAVPSVMESRGVPSAASDGQRILYNHDWVVAMLARYCRDGTCEDQVVLGVVAHELAHHGLGHAFDGQVRPHDSELDADFYAGQVLAIARVGSDHFEAVLFTESPWPTTTHPAGHLRVDAVRDGYARACAPSEAWEALGAP